MIESNAKIDAGQYMRQISFRENVSPQGNRVQAEKRALWRRRKMLKDEAYRRNYVGFIPKILLLDSQIIVHLLGLVFSPGIVNHALIRSVCGSSIVSVCMVWECKTPSF